MADGSVLLEVTVEGKNIKLVQRQVEDLANATNRAADAQVNASVKSKEAADSTEVSARRSGRALNALSGRAKSAGSEISRQASIINTGLVPAYAAIASNIFVLDTAFRILQRNASLEQLENSLDSLGAAAGENFKLISNSIQELSGFALSTQQALQATAQGVGAGFNAKQLQDLTIIAKGASAALGRNLPDSIDRLVRGTAKLEPEILDELGIFVRLDDAAADYAASLKKTAGELTQFERRQAFANAVTTKGLDKFKEIATTVDPNPYDRLGAAISNISVILGKTLNTAIVPFVEFLSQNKFALFSAIALFANTLKRQLSPALEDVAAKASDFAKNASIEAGDSATILSSEYTKQIDLVNSKIKTIPKSFEKLVPSIQQGTASVTELKEGIKSLERSERSRLAKVKGDESKLSAVKQTELNQVRELKKEILGLISIEGQRSKTSFKFFDKTALAASSEAYSNTITKISESTGVIDTLKISLSGVKDQFKLLKQNAILGGQGLNTYQKIALTAKTTTIALSSSIKILGFTFLQIIPIIGQIIAALALLKEGWNYLFPTSEQSKALKNIRDSYEQTSKTIARSQRILTNELSTAAEKDVASLNTRLAILKEIPAAITQLQEASKTDTLKEIEELENRIESLRKKRDKYVEGARGSAGIRRQNITSELKKAQEDLNRLREQGLNLEADSIEVIKQRFEQEVTSAREAGVIFGQELETIRSIFQKAKTDPSVLVDNEELRKSIELLGSVNGAINTLPEAYSEVKKAQAELEKKSNSQYSKLIEKVQAFTNELKTASSITLSSDQIQDAKELANVFQTAFPFLTVKDNINDIIAAINEGINAISKSEEISIRQIEIAKRYSEELNNIQAIAKDNVGFAEAAIKLENLRLNALIKAKNEEISRQKLSGNTPSLIKLGEELQTLKDKALDNEEKTYTLTQAQVAEKRKIFDLENKISAEINKQNNLKTTFQRKELELTRAKTGSSITEEDELNLVIAKNKLEEESQTLIFRLKQQEIDLEYKLLKAKIAFEKSTAQSKANEIQKEIENLTSDNSEETKALQEIKDSLQKNINLQDTSLKIVEKLNRTRNQTLAIEKEITAKSRKANEELAKEKFIRAANRLEAEKQSETLNFITSLAAGSVAKETEKLQLLQTEKQLLEDEQKLVEDFIRTGEGSLALNQKSLEITKNKNAQKLKELEITEQISQELVNQSNLIVSNLKRQYEIESELNILRNKNPITDKPFNLVKQFKLEEENRNRRLEIAQLERNIKLSQIEIEEKLLQAKFKFLEAEARASENPELYKDIVALEKESIKLTEYANNLRRGTILKEEQLLKEQINYEKSRSVFSAIESASPGQGVITAIAAMSQLLSNENKEQASAQREKTETTNEILQGINISINSLPEKIAALIKNPNSPSPTGGGLDIFNGFGPLQSLENVNVNTASGNMGQSVPLSESAQTASAEGENQGTGWASALLLLRGYAKGLAIDLQQFGPGGEALSAFIAGGQELLTSLETIKSAFSTTGLTATEKFVGALQGVSSAIGAIGAISQASADTAVAAIDREISAEKARDGQSKESLSRIKELEAKKEGIRKKAFEQNKKLQTAQAIVNVAAGITQAFASLPFPANIAAAAVMAALGAAQIAAISSQTYGGSSGGGVNAPSEQGTLAVGKRKTEVDLATSRSAAGEIAYFRGEKGIGGPENFKPAFMGAKYRAEGGPTTGYVVGEQGPELFIPEMPGRILENDTIESTQSPTNFNFNINTIDASGVEDILVKQQGNIIGMVRAAANSYGQEFLEPVEIASFTPTAAGVTKY